LVSQEEVVVQVEEEHLVFLEEVVVEEEEHLVFQ
jgi:hypothetical protein